MGQRSIDYSYIHSISNIFLISLVSKSIMNSSVNDETNPAPPRKNGMMSAFGFATVLAVTLLATVSDWQQDPPSLHTTNTHRRLAAGKFSGYEATAGRNTKSDADARIVNGDPAGAGKYRFMVALYSNEAPNPPEDHPVCGASLITPSIALTAAHCVVSIRAAEYGRYDVNDNNGVQFFSNLERRSHPLFDVVSFDYDYALVKFPTDVQDPFLMQLWRTPELPESMTVMGWGVTKFEGVQPDTLMEVNVSRFETGICRTNYESLYDITENMFCAADVNNGRDSCQGDSGGPIIIPGRNVQLGMVSFGNGCGDPTFPGVYSRLDKGYSWIEETICSDLNPQYCVNGKLPYIGEDGQAKPVSCNDLEQFNGLGKKMLTRNCSWVALNTEQRCPWYGEEYCPATCDIKRCSSKV